MPDLIVHGPQGCGKSRCGQQLRTRLGCNAVVDEWCPGDPITPGALHLTHHEPPFPVHADVTVLDFYNLQQRA